MFGLVAVAVSGWVVGDGCGVSRITLIRLPSGTHKIAPLICF